jgi:hypothetical protein
LLLAAAMRKPLLLVGQSECVERAVGCCAFKDAEFDSKVVAAERCLEEELHACVEQVGVCEIDAQDAR